MSATTAATARARVRTLPDPMGSPRLSVLLPTRNGAAYLEGCARSVLAQDSDDMELVIVDNANTDHTASLVSELSHDPRVRSVRLDEPAPVTRSWNTALQAARGDYFLMIGDDD